MLLIVLTTLLCWACSSDDATGSPDGTRPMLTIAVSEQAWGGETVSITRAGETLDALKASTDGFGLYSTRLNLTNQQVSWADVHWDYGSPLLWPDNVVKYSVSFNSQKANYSKDGYFTLTATGTDRTDDINTKFSGCKYNGITFDSALKLYNTTQIGWTSGAHDNKTKVSIVQSTWKADGGTLQPIKFDNTTLSLDAPTTISDGVVATVKDIPGAKLYIIRNVGRGYHTISRAGTETGIFYVSVDIDYTAYAPYKDLSSTPSDGVTACDGSTLTFSPNIGNAIDLLWAEDSVSADGTVNMKFHHALGKLTLGSITNNYGRTVTVKEVKFEGNRYASGTLSLTTGEWSSLPAPSSSSKSFGSDTTPTLSQILEGSPAIPNGESVSFKAGSCYLQIPGPAIKVSYTFSTDDYGDQTVSTDVVLEQGKDKTVNLTIGMNHEVVIK